MRGTAERDRYDVDDSEYEYVPRRRKRSLLPRILLVAVILAVVVFIRPAMSVVRENKAVSNIENLSVTQPDENMIEKLCKSNDIPQELLELVEKNPETYDYVSSYPELHDKSFDIDLSEEASSETVPLLLQWDPRWGYIKYGSGLIGYTGCGPTCLSMVALRLTGDASVTPVAVAAFAEENGYYYEGTGTAWTLMSEGSLHFGLNAEQLPLSEQLVNSALDEGRPIILSLGPGDFTAYGHFVVLAGRSGDGYRVNDPNSIERSKRAWTWDELSPQILNIWAYTKS